MAEGKLKLSRIGSLAMSARNNIDGLATDYEAFNAKCDAHRSDVRGLTEQVAEMDGDLGFSVGVLGNSVADSNAGVVASQPPQPNPNLAPIPQPAVAAVNLELRTDAPGTTQLSPPGVGQLNNFPFPEHASGFDGQTGTDG
jgi:hypothetical protein